MVGRGNPALRIVLVGKTGSGKSATGNTLLGEKKFESKISAKSVTPTCQRATREWKGRKLVVVDTPGLFDTQETMNTTCSEITKCVLYSCPGPHAIVLVLRLGRYTDEEQKTVALIKRLFGKAAMKHMIVLFTQKDDLQGRSLDEFLKDADTKLNSIIQECGGRCLAFNNRAGEAEKEEQAQKLVRLIEKMVQDSGGAYFSDNIYKDTEESMKQLVRDLEKKFTAEFNDDVKRIRQEYSKKLEEQTQKRMNEILTNHEEKMRLKREEIVTNAFPSIHKNIQKKIRHIIDSCI